METPGHPHGITARQRRGARTDRRHKQRPSGRTRRFGASNRPERPRDVVHLTPGQWHRGAPWVEHRSARAGAAPRGVDSRRAEDPSSRRPEPRPAGLFWIHRNPRSDRAAARSETLETSLVP
jgi:hypothetical protein